jgi:diguanylate cyclase (GGDEF)-like protein
MRLATVPSRRVDPSTLALEIVEIVDLSSQLPHTVESTAVALANAAHELTRCPTAVVVLDPATKEASVVAASTGTDRRLIGLTVEPDSAAGRACVSNVIRQASGVGELLGVRRPDRRRWEDTGYVLPLRDGTKGVGALVIFAPPGLVSSGVQNDLATLIDHAGNLLGQRIAARFSKQIGLIDAITGHPNRPGLDKAMREAVPNRCSLVCMTVDDVMELEITLGNAVLRRVAAILRNNLRDYDVLSRTGAEEFAFFLPDATLEGAVVVADRVRSAVVATDFNLGGERAITCSLGVASVPETVPTIDDLIGAASGARKEARESGPNRIATLR